MMNIGIDITAFINQNAGIARYTKNLIQNLLQLDNDNKYLLYSFYGDAKGLKIASNNNASLRAHNYNNQLLKLSSFVFKSIPTNLLTKDADIVHSTDFTLIPSKKKKSVITIHDLAFLRYPNYYTWKNKNFNRSAAKKAAKNADRFIVYSKSTQQDLVDLLGVDENKIALTPLGVENIFKPSKSDRINKIRTKYQLPERYLLTISTLQPRKNLLNLLRAYKQLVNKNTDVFPLVVAGAKGWSFENTLEKMKKLYLEEKVKLVGFIEDNDLPSLYSGAEIFIYPSLFEGFGLPIIEAMACGTPVVCSNTSSMPEAAGKSAITFDPTNIDSIAWSINQVLDNKEIASTMRTKGFEQASKFSWQETARKTLEVYNRVK